MNEETEAGGSRADWTAEREARLAYLESQLASERAIRSELAAKVRTLEGQLSEAEQRAARYEAVVEAAKAWESNEDPSGEALIEALEALSRRIEEERARAEGAEDELRFLHELMGAVKGKGDAILDDIFRDVPDREYGPQPPDNWQAQILALRRRIEELQEGLERALAHLQFNAWKGDPKNAKRLVAVTEARSLLHPEPKGKTQ